MVWIEQKAKYQKRFDELAEINIKKLIAELNILTQKYITHGGVTENATNTTKSALCQQMNVRQTMTAY